MTKATKFTVPLNSQKDFKNQFSHSKAKGYPVGRPENLLLAILGQLFLTFSKTNFLKNLSFLLNVETKLLPASSFPVTQQEL